MAQSEHTDETGLPEWIADAILLNSLKELKTQSLSLFTYAVEVLSHFEIENACVRLVPQIAYIPAEVIDGEEESPQVCFVWPLKQRTLRLYISEERVLISDPNGPLFGQVSDTSQLEKVTHTVMTELLQRVKE